MAIAFSGLIFHGLARAGEWWSFAGALAFSTVTGLLTVLIATRLRPR